MLEVFVVIVDVIITRRHDDRLQIMCLLYVHTGSRRPCFGCRDEEGLIDPDKYPFNSTSGELRQLY